MSNAFSALSIYFVEEDWLQSWPVLNTLHFGSAPYLSSWGWPSGSTILNSLTVILVVIILIIIHLTLFLIYRYTRLRYEKFSKYVSKVLDYFKFSIYLRLFFEIYMFVLIMPAYEIYAHILSATDEDFRLLKSLKLTKSSISDFR